MWYNGVMKRTYYIRAFTLIELLVSIAIIALLTGIVVTSLTPSKAKARDSKRISDIGNLQVALALYFDRCKQYPATLTTGANNCVASGVTLGSYISVIPTAPLPGTYDYAVKTSGTVIDYVLHTKLESYNEIIKDALPPNSGTGSGWSVATGSAFSCTNTAGGTDYCIGSK